MNRIVRKFPLSFIPSQVAGMNFAPGLGTPVVRHLAWKDDRLCAWIEGELDAEDAPVLQFWAVYSNAPLPEPRPGFERCYLATVFRPGTGVTLHIYWEAPLGAPASARRGDEPARL